MSNDEQYIILKQMCAEIIKKVNEHHEKIKELDKAICINFPRFEKYMSDDEKVHMEIAQELKDLGKTNSAIKEHVRSDDVFQERLVNDIESIKEKIGVRETSKARELIKAILIYGVPIVVFFMTYQSYKDKVDLNKENIGVLFFETKALILSQAKTEEKLKNIEEKQSAMAVDVKALLRKVDRINR